MNKIISISRKYVLKEGWILKSMNRTELDNNEEEKFKDGLNRYVNTEGVDSILVNIPTIITGVNDDGTISQEEVQPNAYEIVEQDKRFID